jgi:hypothetical protein
MSFFVDYFTLQPQDATNHYVSLTYMPSGSTQVAMDVISGTAQTFTAPNMDFHVDSSNVKWDSTVYSLYTLLAAGDKIRVIYDRS